MKNRFSLQLSPTATAGFTSPTLFASPPSLKNNASPTTSPVPSNLTMSYDQESDIFEDITLNFTLPDGSTFSYKAKTGDTVLEVKRKLDTSKGIAARSCTLFWDGKYMMDPLSLNDIPGLVSKSEVQIEVKVSQSATPATQQHHMQQHHPQQYHQHFEGLKKQYIEDMQRAPYARCKSAVFATETINKESSTQISSPHLPKKLHNGHDTVGSLSSSPYRATIQPLPLSGLSFLTDAETADMHQSSPKLASTIAASPEKEKRPQMQTDSSCSSLSTMSSGITSSSSASPITPSSTLGKKSGSLLLNLKLSELGNNQNNDTASSPKSPKSPTNKPKLPKAASDTAIFKSRTTASPRTPKSPSNRSSVTETKDEKRERKMKEKVEKRMSRRMTKIESMKDSNKPASPRKLKPLEDFSASKRSCIVM